MRPILTMLLWLAVTVTTGAQGIISNGARDQERREIPDSLEVRPFSTAEISGAFSLSNSLISQAEEIDLSISELRRNREEMDTLFSVIDHFLKDSSVMRLEGGSIRELDNISQRIDFYSGEAGKIRNRLSVKVVETEVVLKEIAATEQRWQRTMVELLGEELYENRLYRIERTSHRLDSVSGLLQGDLEEMLVQQGRLTDKQNELETLTVRVREMRARLGERLFTREMPGFFRDLSSLGDSAMVSKHTTQLRNTLKSDMEIMRSEYAVSISVVSLVFIVFLVFAIWYKRHFATMISVEKFEISEMHMTLIYHPFVTVLFIVAFLLRFLLPNLPQSFSSLNMIAMMVPMMIIVIRLFGSQIRSWILVLIIVYSLSFLYELAYYPDIYLRIILLGFSVAGIWLFTWIFIRKPLANRFHNNFIYRLFRTLLLFFAVLLFISLLANLAGAFSLAEFFALIPIQLAVLAIGIQVSVKVADTIVFLLLSSNYMQKVNVVREEYQVIYRKTVWLIDIVLWIFFFVTALSIFRVRDAFFEWGRGVLTNGIRIGEVELSLGNILIFIVVIWLSIIITRIIRHVLEKDVFTRVSVSKGVPGTIVLLVRIVLITAGFFLAAAAAGMKLTNLSIVLGAFSVGIGFGLQNIFNNMVSGLILAFERPIKVGDTVEVGELIGIVRSIGLRSSTVHSFDGAEVIVPNGNLISNQMINWTLTDSYRRMDIRVGVAYGTDPEKVLELLQETAFENPQVNKYPAPKAFFIGFGESSLDFRLLAWADIDVRLAVESDLNVAVNRKLKEAGIGIPFPQRDLHIRSDATKPGPAVTIPPSPPGRPKG